MRCRICKNEKRLPDKRGSERLPRGWKRFRQDAYCGKCWGQKFHRRSLVLAVTKPMDIAWDELTEVLEMTWRRTTQLSNAIVTKLATLEPSRTPEMTRMPKSPDVYLYPWARQEFPDLDLQSTNCLIHSVRQTYNRFRLDVFWRRNRSLPQYRYPTPAPLPGPSTKLEWLSETEKVPIATVRLGGDRIRLQLAAKHQKNFKAAVGQIIDGEAKLCECSIYRKISHGSHRRGVISRAPGGGQRFHSQVFVKLTAWFPNPATSGPPKRRHLRISTGDRFFLSATLSGMEQWKLNAEHVRRWTRSHQQRLQRLADDRKYERRQTSKHRIPINEFCAKLADKHRRRISTFQKQTCAELVAYAERNGCRKIIWEREDSGFLPSFPWYEFESLVEQQAALRGISFERAEKAAAQLTASN